MKISTKGRYALRLMLDLALNNTGEAFIVWKKINDAINEVVDNITLEDLVEWYHSKSDDYVI